MRLFATLSLCTATAALLCGWAVEAAESFGINLFPALRDQEAAIARAHRQRDDFVVHLDRIMADVASGKTSLRAGARALEQRAAARYPSYLGHLDATEAPRRMHTKIAHNLLRNFRRPPLDDTDRVPSADRLRELESEYAEIAAAD